MTWVLLLALSLLLVGVAAVASLAGIALAVWRRARE